MKTIITLIFVFSAVICLSADFPNGAAAVDISSPVEFRKQAFDVLHYDVFCNFREAPKKTMFGTCTITFVWTEFPDTNLFYFNLRDLNVDTAYFETNIPAHWEKVGTPESPIFCYAVQPLPQHKSGDTVKLSINYSGTMTGEGGTFQFGGVQSSETCLFGMGVGFHLNYVSSTCHWMPCYDHPSDKATFRGKFAVNYDKFCASVGNLVEEYFGDATNMFTWETTYPTATYLLTFAVDEYVPVNFQGASVPAVVYCRREDTTAIQHTFKLLPNMVDAYEDRFGPYPFEKAGYCMTSIGAMEHQTMIAYPISHAKSLYASRDTINVIAAHELAHQWFGNLVSPLDFRHAWLNESFATFCESIWYEYLFGKNGYLASQEAHIKGYLTYYKSEGTLPLYDFSREEPSSNYPATIYYKGSPVVGMLRYKLGDGVFFEAVKEFLKQGEYGCATTEMLKSILEDKSGQDLDYFFERWVEQIGFPQLEINTNKYMIGDDYFARINVKQVQPKAWGIFEDLPIEIGIKWLDGTYTHYIFELDDVDQTFYVEQIPDFTEVIVNKGPTLRTLLEVKQLNLLSADDTGNNENISAVISPNPAGDFANLIISGKQGELKFRVFNTIGNEISSDIINASNSGSIYDINTSELTSGVYFVNIFIDGKVLTEKLVVVH